MQVKIPNLFCSPSNNNEVKPRVRKQRQLYHQARLIAQRRWPMHGSNATRAAVVAKQHQRDWQSRGERKWDEITTNNNTTCGGSTIGSPRNEIPREKWRWLQRGVPSWEKQRQIKKKWIVRLCSVHLIFAYFRSNQIISHQIRKNKFKSYKIRSDQIRPDLIMLIFKNSLLLLNIFHYILVKLY